MLCQTLYNVIYFIFKSKYLTRQKKINEMHLKINLKVVNI